MEAKLRAVPLPDVRGKRVLDCGCDFGGWCFLAAERGAADVLGLDRNRVVRGLGYLDLIDRNSAEAREKNVPCRFVKTEMGKQWHSFGAFDVVLMLSVYHHVYEVAGGDHLPIWFWLRKHCADNGQLLWEGPVDDSDPVVRANVSGAHLANYTREKILAAATVYFEAEHIGPALHEPTREVWRFWPKKLPNRSTNGTIRTGAGGATPAFEYANGRRMDEIEHAVGVRPIPGSLNVVTDGPFWWSTDYYRAQVLDVAERGNGLDVEWRHRWARFYPVTVESVPAPAFAFRFEGERYPERFVELVSDVRLRDLNREVLTLCR